MRLLIVANPNSGRGRAADVQQVIASGLAARGHVVDARSIADALSSPPSGIDYQAAIFIGGDGTVHAFLEWAVQWHVPLWHAPLGTENLFARHFGMTRNVHSIAAAVEAGVVKRIDTALANGRRFALMCSVGFDADVVREVAARRRGAIRRVHYLTAAGRRLLRPLAHPLKVEVDGVTLVDGLSGMVVFANAPEYGGRLNPAPRAVIDDGLLDVIFFPIEAPTDLVEWTVRSWSRNNLGTAGLISARCRSARVESLSEPAWFQVDGESSTGDETHADQIQMTPLSINVSPLSLSVLLPIQR